MMAGAGELKRAIIKYVTFAMRLHYSAGIDFGNLSIILIADFRVRTSNPFCPFPGFLEMLRNRISASEAFEVRVHTIYCESTLAPSDITDFMMSQARCRLPMILSPAASIGHVIYLSPCREHRVPEKLRNSISMASDSRLAVYFQILSVTVTRSSHAKVDGPYDVPAVRSQVCKLGGAEWGWHRCPWAIY